MEWWYWSAAADTVVIMAVRLLPLRPSFSSLESKGSGKEGLLRARKDQHPSRSSDAIPMHYPCVTHVLTMR